MLVRNSLFIDHSEAYPVVRRGRSPPADLEIFVLKGWSIRSWTWSSVGTVSRGEARGRSSVKHVQVP